VIQRINSNNILKFSYIILVVGIILVIISPFIFTRQLGFISFQETGQIGDTIGGITAPIVNLIGAVLVFFALQAQIEANKIIQSQIDEQKSDAIKSKNFTNLLKIYDELKKDIQEFTHTRDETIGDVREIITGNIQANYVTYKGNEAISKAYNQIKRSFCSSINNERITNSKSAYHETFLCFLNLLDALLSKTSKSDLLSEDRDTFVSLLKYLFENKLKPSLSEDAVCKKCKKDHNELPNDLHELVGKIQNDLEKSIK
jgi:hypothetical protein